LCPFSHHDDGVRNPRKYVSVINLLNSYFGSKKLSQITVSDLARFRNERLKTVKIATVNRELSLMRAMLSTAVQRKYLDVSPFDYAEPGELISVAAEDSRSVTITPDRKKRCSLSVRRSADAT